jgi:hypothetical protein
VIVASLVLEFPELELVPDVDPVSSVCAGPSIDAGLAFENICMMLLSPLPSIRPAR